MGLFRIIYAAFYIWHLSWVDAAALGLLPDAVWQPVGLLRLVPARTPSVLPGMIESGLVAALVLLLAGLCVRPVTLVVLVLGTLLETFHQSFGKVEHASIFLVFYIPLFMLTSDWGGTWSLDALLARRAGRATTHPSDDSWCHALPMRGVLLMLVLMFASAAFAKGVLGTWLTAPDLVADLLLGKNVEAVREGLPSHAILPVVAANPLLSHAFRYGVLLFECLFVLVLLGGRLRAVVLSAALVFHALNALLLVVTFTPILIVYAMFVDWQAGIERFGASHPMDRAPGPACPLLAAGRRSPRCRHARCVVVEPDSHPSRGDPARWASRLADHLVPGAPAGARLVAASEPGDGECRRSRRQSRGEPSIGLERLSAVRTAGRHYVVHDQIARRRREMRRLLAQHVLRPGPRRVAVREVVGPHEAHGVHEVRRLERGPVVLEGQVDVLAEILPGQPRELARADDWWRM